MKVQVVSRYSQDDVPHHRSPPRASAVVGTATKHAAKGRAHRVRLGPSRHAAPSTSASAANQPTNCGVTSPASVSHPFMNQGTAARTSICDPTRIHATPAIYAAWMHAFHRRSARKVNANGRSAGATAGIRKRESMFTGKPNQYSGSIRYGTRNA